MEKESVQKFDLEAAFKALNEVEIPTVKGIRPNRENLQEKFTRKLTTDLLVEDYFDVSDANELEQASEEREGEIAKAKLARIEKIVDLNAETEEDLLPSYVGKLIMQCPQCMTLFYKNEEDIEKSEENPEVVNINEPCQHCGNSSGYTLIGKVDTVGEDEAAQYDVEDFDENELDLDFDEEESVEEEEVEEPTEDVATEEEEELDLEPVADEGAEEEVKESLTEATITISRAEMAKLDKEVEDAQKEVAKYNIPVKAQKNSAGETENVPDFEAVPEAQREAAKKAYDRYQKALEARPDRTKNIIKYTEESLTESAVKQRVFVDYTGSNEAFKDTYAKQLEKDGVEDFEAVDDSKMNELVAAVTAGDNVVLYTVDDDYKYNCPEIVDKTNFKVVMVTRELKEDVDLNKQLDLYNDFIKYLQKMVEQDEEALEEAKKLGNKEVIAAIEKRLENSKAELKAALPTTVKDEVAVEELPTPEEADMKAAAENTEDDKKEKKESLTEDVDTERKLKAEEAELAKTNAEDYVVESKAVDALTELEKELTEAKYNVSDADFRAMLKNPVFNEDCKKDLDEDLPPVDATAFEKAADAIENAGSELTPEEQRLEDEELASQKSATNEDLILDEDTGITPQPTVVPTIANPTGSLLKRKLSATEIIAKKLAAHPLFKKLSVRTIQRVLLPYYIEQMGRDGISVEAVVEFFEFEGFATYALDHFMTIDSAARKELLKADEKFMTIFNDYAKEYNLFPSDASELEAVESEFDYIFSILFDMDAEGNILDTEVTRSSLQSFTRMYAAGKFDKALVVESLNESDINSSNVEANAWESIEDLDDDTFNKLTEKYLTEVYSNVKSFEATSCDLCNNKLVVEGIINFISGKTKPTTFTYKIKKATNNCVVLEGLNTDFSIKNAFRLNCKLNTAKRLIVESLSYKYTINNTLVEGLLK